MAKLETRWLILDLNSLENSGGNLQVKLVAAGALERTANGINVKDAGVTDAMLAGNIAFSKLADANVIARLDQNETITGTWNFTGTPPTIAGKEVSTKEYVDAVAAGLDPKDSVKALSTTNRDVATGGLPSSVDSVTSWSAGDRILLTGQTTGTENGIWEVQTGAWTRPSDFDTGFTVAGAFTFVEQGNNYAESGWTCTNDKGSDVVDTDVLSFTQFSGAGSITAGAALNKVGNTLNVVPSELILGGNAEIDGDQLGIDFTPSNYTPNTTPPEANDVKQLTPHLAGIDDALGAVGQTAVDRFVLSGTDITNKYVTLSATPKAANRVTLKIRGAGAQNYGDDYVMDGVQTDRLTWSGLDLDGQLSSGDKLIVRYDV